MGNISTSISSSSLSQMCDPVRNVPGKLLCQPNNRYGELLVSFPTKSPTPPPKKQKNKNKQKTTAKSSPGINMTTKVIKIFVGIGSSDKLAFWSLAVQFGHYLNSSITSPNRFQPDIKPTSFGPFVSGRSAWSRSRWYDRGIRAKAFWLQWWSYRGHGGTCPNRVVYNNKKKKGQMEMGPTPLFVKWHLNGWNILCVHYSSCYVWHPSGKLYNYQDKIYFREQCIY